MNILGAALTQNEALGLAWLGLCAGVSISFSWFATLAIIKAYRRRTKGWIMLGSIGGLFMIAAWVLVVIVAITIALDIHRKASKTAQALLASKVAQIIQGQKVGYHFVLPAGWIIEWDSKNFDITAECDGLHLEIVAAKSVGLTRVISKMARDKILKETTETRLGSVSSTEVDGHNWQEFVASFRYPKESTCYYYQYAVYSGAEGMFQIIGWQTRPLGDHDTNTLREIVASFRFPASDGPWTVTAPPVTLTNTQVIEGTRAAYKMSIPTGWLVWRRGYKDFDLQASRGNLRFAVMVEPEVAAASEELLRFTQKRALRKNDKPHISATSSLLIDGREWLHFTEEFEAEGHKYLEEDYVYAGPEGAFQLLGMAHAEDYPQDESALREVVTSFRFPSSIESQPQTIQGRRAAYKLTLPAHWQAKYSQDDCDVLASRGNIFFAVSISETTIGTCEEFAKNVQERVKKTSPDFQAGETTSVRIDGRGWLQFTTRYHHNKVPLTVQHKVYVGPEGTFHLTGWTTQELYNQNVNVFDEVAASFHFPPAAAALPLELPVVAPTDMSTPLPTVPVATPKRRQVKPTS